MWFLQRGSTTNFRRSNTLANERQVCYQQKLFWNKFLFVTKFLKASVVLRCHQCANIAGLFAKLLCQMKCNLFSVINRSSYSSVICSHTSRMCWAFQDRANPDLVRTRRVDKGDGKTKAHVAAMVESQWQNIRILKPRL